ncbi:hypothetical protein FSARC_3177 [Fusarium sarcochroum]|uniref:CFEM domain-containing protein n=1 Tax=Fusarium sarcochroum TaxID=1208366 RepID=A0A8H4U4H5_9HYPO|nr:hypothetical protein FSARC_3177 [Fusarium sarcochroum]
MANAGAKSLAEAIPECMSSCWDISIASTGCDDGDYDCWCYAKNHQTVVDTMEQCLGNQERKLKQTCSKADQFKYENSYWKICEQYWEDYGTATEPTGSATSVSSAAKATSTLEVSASQTTLTSSLSTATADPSRTNDSEQAEASGEVNGVTVQENNGLSTGAQAGIGVGVALGVIFIGVAVFLWLRERRRRRSLEEQLRVAEVEKANGGSPPNYQNHLYEMEGDRPHAEELRGCMRTPELGAAQTFKSGSSTEVAPVSPTASHQDSEFSTHSYNWPISPESPARNRESGALGELQESSLDKRAAP